MKNDIDSILDSMFRGGRLNLKKPGPQPSGTSAGKAPSLELGGEPPQKTATEGRAASGTPIGTDSRAADERPIDSSQTINADSMAADERLFENARSLEAASGRTMQAAQTLDALNAAQAGLSQSLQQSIERMARDAQSDLADLERHLQIDGMSSQAANNAGNASDLDAAFETARQEALVQVLGQEDFVNALVLAFKRPFVAGTSGDMPLCRAAVLGRPGSGRRLGIQAVCASLGRQGVLKSPKVATVDLAAYNAPGSEKLFIQDLYSAIKSGASALVFTGYDGCHPSVLPMAAALFSTGRVPLPSRYAEQKGLLVDVGSALAPGAVSSLSAGGKYLFLLAHGELSRLTGAFGSIFVSGLDDVLATGDFSADDLEAIADARLKDLCARAKSQLGFELEFSPAGSRLLAKAYHPDQGAAAITKAAQALYKAMSEEKLQRGLHPPLKASLSAQGDELVIEYRAENISGSIRPAPELSGADTAELEAVRAQLQGIVGLESVKEHILGLEDNFKMQQLRRRRGLKAETPSMHMIFTGNPGTGKTTVARLAARYLKAMGALTGGQLVEVTRADLVGQYVGHTAPLTQRAIQSAMGGVLFIDEAYSLYRGRDDSFGLEAIDSLVKGMEDHRDKLVVILAGYSREMEEFLTANSGLRSRFPNIIEFPDYSAEELLSITESIVSGMGYRLADGCKAPLIGYYQAMQLTADPRTSGNGRMARNKVEAAVIACARRNMRSGDAAGAQDLELLLPEDFGFEPEKTGGNDNERED